jgi:molybdopterin molybdotransferase
VPEFLSLLPPDQALNRLLEHIAEAPPAMEVVDVRQSLGRVLAAPVCAPHALPAFSRSTVDGFAVIAADTYGASDSLPAYLRLAGEVPMGKPAGLALTPGEAALIHTGGMLPAAANAVVMIEYTQAVRSGEIEILRPVAPGENVLQKGEDVAEGEEVLRSGVRVRPAELGGLMALGIKSVRVARPPRVGILSSGDEVVGPDVEPGPGQVRDINSFSLQALIEQAGGAPVLYGIVPDDESLLRQAVSRTLLENDMVVITAGSSASTRDLTAQVVHEMGPPGVLVHGVNVKPGKPTILAVCQGKPVVGLPGNPVSALVIARLFILPVLEKLLGITQRKPMAGIPAVLATNLASQAGREDWVPVRLLPGRDGYQADPIFFKSNLIFNLAHADGLVRIPADATGLGAGEQVTVFPL